MLKPTLPERRPDVSDMIAQAREYGIEVIEYRVAIGHGCPPELRALILANEGRVWAELMRRDRGPSIYGRYGG